jgi:hypothetical protein
VIESERRRHGGLESAPVVRELATDQVAPQNGIAGGGASSAVLATDTSEQLTVESWVRVERRPVRRGAGGRHIQAVISSRT